MPFISISGLGNVYPAFSNREPAPAIGINILSLSLFHFLFSVNVLSIFIIKFSISSNVTSLGQLTGNKCAPDLKAPLLPIYESSIIKVSSGFTPASIIQRMYISALGFGYVTCSFEKR